MFFLILLMLVPFNAAAHNTPLAPEIDVINRNGALFPHVYFSETVHHLQLSESSKPYWVSTSDELDAVRKFGEEQLSILLNNDILAYYGHPHSRNMGILGRYPIEELDEKLTSLAKEYEQVSGGRGIIKAFYLIYGTAWPEGKIGLLSDATVKRYIEYGLENDVLIFVDHQIGRYDPIDALKKMLPWLHYPNVHLALDPEWRTDKPNKKIGNLTAEEINLAQQVMEEYMIEKNIPGERLLVIHQFNHVMIKDRRDVRSDFNRVRLIHCADGFGSPKLKRLSYAYNALAENMPVKGFKLFYNFGIPGAGYDEPLLTPKEVYELTPRPYVIMYQ